MLFQFKAALRNYGLEAGQTEGATGLRLAVGWQVLRQTRPGPLRFLICFDRV